MGALASRSRPPSASSLEKGEDEAAATSSYNARATSLGSMSLQPQNEPPIARSTRSSVRSQSQSSFIEWIHPKASAEECDAFLREHGEGAFVVYQPELDRTEFMLAVKTGDTITHVTIRQNSVGLFALAMPDIPPQPEFYALIPLVKHYQQPQPGIPFTLMVENPSFSGSNTLARGDAEPTFLDDEDVRDRGASMRTQSFLRDFKPLLIAGNDFQNLSAKLDSAANRNSADNDAFNPDEAAAGDSVRICQASSPKCELRCRRRRPRPSQPLSPACLTCPRQPRRFQRTSSGIPAAWPCRRRTGSSRSAAPSPTTASLPLRRASLASPRRTLAAPRPCLRSRTKCTVPQA